MSFQPPTPPTGGPYDPQPLAPTQPLPPIGGAQPSGQGAPGPRRARGRNAAIVAAVVLGATTIGAGVWATSLSGTADDRDETIESLRDANDDLDRQASELADDATSSQQELDDANATIDSLTDELDAANDDLAAVEEELDAANETITALEGGDSPGTTAPPDTEPDDGELPPFDPADPTNDGVVSEIELSTVVSVLGSTLEGAPELTLEQAQDIADRVCALTSPMELFDAAEEIGADYLPDSGTGDAVILMGGIAGVACIDRLTTIAG